MKIPDTCLLADVQTGLKKSQVQDFIDFQQTHRSENCGRRLLCAGSQAGKAVIIPGCVVFILLLVTLVPTTYFAWCVYLTIACQAHLLFSSYPRTPTFIRFMNIFSVACQAHLFLCNYVRPRSSGLWIYSPHTCANTEWSNRYVLSVV